ncbi:MAG: type II toxin-antitoxin system VapC family toxin [Spirochaetia bacterium]|jgi:tRNA(fMet)-specific endonuclease VapC|nr:type II toxin-antitoxin system VapC family toxin [Spirochaetia bacterium]
MKKVSLDTNAYSALITGDITVLDALGEATEVYLSIFVIGELYYGFSNGYNEEKNRTVLNKFLKKPTVKIIHTTMETAEIYGRLKINLKKKGTPVPINDLWIAAHAIETGSFLLTYDSHFKTIPEVLLY